MTAALVIGGAIVARGGAHVVRGVDLRVEAGCWFGVIGANGSGKTSLLRAIAGRLPFAAGSCALAGVELARDRAGRARRFGFAPPQEALPDALRVAALFDLVGGEGVLDRLAGIRAPLELDRLMNRWIGACSAGMRQRVAIALAFAAGHRWVVLDEPFNWLDPVAAYDLRQALRGLVDDGVTLVTALHDMTTLAAACDSGAMLADGCVARMLEPAALVEAAADPAGFERRMIDHLRSAAARTGPAIDAAGG